MKNKFKMTKLQTVFAIALLFAAEFFSDSVAGRMAPQANLKYACLATTTNAPSYMVAVERVTSLPMVKDWGASLGVQSRMALGWNDKTEFVGGHCYWSISFYKSDAKQMQLWKIFRVDVTSNDIYVMDENGNYLPLASSLK